MTYKQKFESKLKFDPTTGCWIWKKKYAGNSGYPQMQYEGKYESAHRISYQLYNGPIPNDQWVLHTCDTRRCCNPSHLILGDRDRNVRDMVERGRATGGPKLQPRTVLELRSRPKYRGCMKDWAKELDVSYITIYSILTNRTWKDLSSDLTN